MTQLFQAADWPELFDLDLWKASAPVRRTQVATQALARLGPGYAWEDERHFAGAGFSMAGFRHRRTDLVFNLIPGGRFLMGMTTAEIQQFAAIDQGKHRDILDSFPTFMQPVHAVQTGPLLVARIPLTQALADRHAALGDNPGRPDFDGEPSSPFYVDYDEACSVVRSTGFRLPSESEYEYVTRAGQQCLFYFGNTLPGRAELEKICTIDLDTAPNDSPWCNQFGLFGLAVGSFCADTWHPTYEGAPADGSAWVNGPDGRVHVVRGGGTSLWPWQDAGEWMTLASAMRLRSDHMYEEMAGLRLVCSLEEAAGIA